MHSRLCARRSDTEGGRQAKSAGMKVDRNRLRRGQGMTRMDPPRPSEIEAGIVERQVHGWWLVHSPRRNPRFLQALEQMVAIDLSAVGPAVRQPIQCEGAECLGLVLRVQGRQCRFGLG